MRYNVSTGKSVGHPNLPLFLQRNGIVEETYFSFTITPVIGDDGVVIGHHQKIVESSKEVIYQRRMDTMLKVGEQISLVHDLSTAWIRILEVFEPNDKDIPFALVYSVEDVSSPGLDASFTTKHCVLRGTIGVPDGHPAAPANCDLQNCYDGFVPYFREASNFFIQFHANFTNKL